MRKVGHIWKMCSQFKCDEMSTNSKVAGEVSHALILKLPTGSSQLLYRTFKFTCGLRHRFIVDRGICELINSKKVLMTPTAVCIYGTTMVQHGDWKGLLISGTRLTFWLMSKFQFHLRGFESIRIQCGLYGKGQSSKEFLMACFERFTV